MTLDVLFRKEDLGSLVVGSPEDLLHVDLTHAALDGDKKLEHVEFKNMAGIPITIAK